MATTRVRKPLAIHLHGGKDGIIVCNDPGEEASQTYKAGAPLVYDSAEVEVLSAATATTSIIGIAAGPASGTAGTKVLVYEANDSNVFKGTLVNGTADIALAVTHIGAQYPLVTDTAANNNWYIDVSSTDAKKVEVIAAIDPIGDSNAQVAFRFLGGIQENVKQS